MNPAKPSRWGFTLTFITAALMVVICLISVTIIMITRSAGYTLNKGTTLAYSSTRNGNADIYLTDLTRGWLRPVTRSSAYDGEPSFSPDGTRIAFASQREGNSDIFIMNLDGTGLRNLTRHPANESMPVWTADGAWVAFTSDWNGNYANYLMSVDDTIMNTTGWRPIPSTRAYYDIFGASPDRTKIVYVNAEPGRSDIFVQTLTGMIKQVTHQQGSSFTPIWSPDSRRIAYGSTSEGNLDIFIVDADGNLPPINLTAHPATDYLPAWSPDGRQIAFVSDRNGTDDIYLATVDGELLRRLTYMSGTNTTPVWMP